MTDSHGEVVWKGYISPFGDSATGEGSIQEAVKFTGKELDPETGLYYFNARWYDPVLGRFTTEDPARDGVNWFVYVGHNPLRFIDPTGLLGIAEDTEPTGLESEDRGSEEHTDSGMLAAEDRGSVDSTMQVGLSGTVDAGTGATSGGGCRFYYTGWS